MGPAIGKTEKTRGTDLSPNLQCAFQWNWICMFQSLEIFQFKRAIFWIRLFIKVWTNKSLNCRRPKIDGCPGEIWDRPKVNNIDSILDQSALEGEKNAFLAKQTRESDEKILAISSRMPCGCSWYPRRDQSGAQNVTTFWPVQAQDLQDCSSSVRSG